MRAFGKVITTTNVSTYRRRQKEVEKQPNERILGHAKKRSIEADSVSEKLPAQGNAIHAIYSGTQVGVLFDPSIDAPLQNATTCHMPGDLIWMHYPALSRFAHPDAVSEICWAYDRHTRMVMPGQFVQIAGSVFATFAGGADEWSAFAARSAQVRWDGQAQVRISMYSGVVEATR